MAAKLVIIKQKRESTDVAFFAASAETKAAVQAAGLKGIVGERNFKGGLTKIRTLFFPTVELFDAWAADATVQAAHAERAAFNEANGITETQRVIDMPNLVV